MLTGVLGLATLLLGQFLRINQAPTDSGASGFGAGATKTLYDDVTKVFSDVSCEPFIQNKDLANGLTITATIKYKPENGLPLICYYKLSDESELLFQLFSYNESSFIDNSQDDLFNRINGKELANSLNEGESKGVNYFFGNAVNENDNRSQCKTTFFHVQNDFEYARLTFNSPKSCSELTTLNTSISQNISSVISDLLIGVNSNFINEAISTTDYKNIRQALQSVSCTYLLTRRTDREANSPEIIFNENSYFKTLPSEEDIIKNCEYKFDATTTYNLKIRGIDLGVETDPTNFKQNIEQLFDGDMQRSTENDLEFNYGSSIENSDQCRTIIFLKNDNYTYLDLNYKANDCANVSEVKNIVINFTRATSELIENIKN